MRRRWPEAVLALLVASALAACNTGGGAAAIQAAPAVLPPSPTAEPTATASPSPSAEPSASPTPTPPAKPAYDVAAVQQRLTDLKYYAGGVDGRPGPVLTAAVMAFQKVNGLSVDGVVGPQVLGALAAPKAPVLRASSPADRLEVDLGKQVLYLVKGGAIVRIMAVSSGNGATYRNKDGSNDRALTPVGWYTIGRRVRGPEVAPLGVLYDPQYFYQGWAIHGSDSVPAYPASHGCVRINRWDGTWLFGQVGPGTPVYLYDGAYTFTAGSSAPGTSTPAGDGPAGAGPAGAAAQPAPAQPKATSTSPSSTGSASASASPSATASPSKTP